MSLVAYLRPEPSLMTRIDRSLEHMMGSVPFKRGLQNLLGRARGASPAPLPVRPGRSGELDQEIRLPVAGIYVRWDLEAPVATLEWDLNVLADPTSSVGIYLALAQGRIDGSAFYLGLQTDIWDPGRVRGAGKGLIFSTWWTFDAGATRLAPGGFRELGTHEGRFVGVRRPYPWAVGDYRVTLVRSEPAAGMHVPADWFDLYIQPTAPRDTGQGRPELVGDQTWIGGLAFPRRLPSMPAMTEETSTAFMEVYSRVRRWGDIPPWDVDLMAYGDGRLCPAERPSTPSSPSGTTARCPTPTPATNWQAAWSSCDTAAQRTESTRRGAGRRDCERYCAIHSHPILFTDIVGSTELSRRLSPGVADNVRRGHIPGANPKEAAARAGHTSASFTLVRYGHLLPGSEQSLNDALDALAEGTQAT